MYLKHYGLSREPFGVTPDPDFLFLSPTHREALASVIYGIRERKGFIAITGEVGSGKTTILRSALERLDPDLEKPIYVFNCEVTFPELLQTILNELGIEEVPESTDGRVRLLHEILIQEYASKRNVYLVIDEAQNMPVRTLESLRMLSNLETTKDKLLQILLIGQPELDDKLNRHELRQLKQRIAVRAVISLLTKEESLEYIRHRLLKANAPRVWIFTEGAKYKIVEHAHGSPRLINILADNALVAGFGYQKRVVTTRMVEEVVQDFVRTRAVEAEPETDRARVEWEAIPSPETSLSAGVSDPLARDALNAIVRLLNSGNQPQTNQTQDDSGQPRHPKTIPWRELGTTGNIVRHLEDSE